MALDEMNTLDLGSAIPTTAPSAADASSEPEIELEIEGGNDSQEQDVEVVEEGTPDPFSDYEEIEVDGEKFKVPAKIKDGFLRTADYTQKSQANAELKRSLESRMAEVDALAQATNEELNMRSALMGIDHQLKQYDGVDFLALQREDPLGAQEKWMHFQQLKDAKQQISGHLTEAQQQRAVNAERDLATRIQETAAYAYKNLPGMSKELDDKITDFATRELGFTRDTLKQSYNPQIYRTLYLAHLGHQTLNKAQAPKPVQSQAPVPTVTPKGGTVRKTAAEMTVAEMSRFLNKR